MKNLAIIFVIAAFALTASAQTPKSSPKKPTKTSKTPAKTGTAPEELAKIKSITDASERISAIETFFTNFGDAAEVAEARDLLVRACTELANKHLDEGKKESGLAFVKKAVESMPVPVPAELYEKFILGFPISLFARNERGAAFDTAKLIEDKIGANAPQVLDLARFYINVKYGTEAIRLAQKSIDLAPTNIEGYETLAVANRLNFRLEDAAAAYAKLIEIDPSAKGAMFNLADLKRALGKADESLAIYRQILEKDPADANARAGLTLTLLDTDKKAEAEAELNKTLEAEPNSVKVLTGAAFWYVRRGDAATAISLAEKAILLDQTSVWAYVAQSRALLLQKKPLEAEKLLLNARRFGDFPTLDYELAAVRMAAGFYRDAAEILKRNFYLNKDGTVGTFLGNRIQADADSFIELLSLERRVAIFEPNAIDSAENSGKLKALLRFADSLEAKDANADEIAAAAEEFAAGSDNMRLHRQLFVANRLLFRKTALPKVLELMQSAVRGVDSALDVPNPTAAVMADELYESRQYAFGQNLILNVADVPRQTLSSVLRGRIEDIAGQTLLQQSNPAQAIVRFKRALSVLPEKSAFSRSASWHLGEALLADGKEKEALEAYIRGYDQDFPDVAKRDYIETIYLKVNGNINGLEDRVGAKPNATVAKVEPAEPVTTVEPTPAPTPEAKIEPTPEPTPEATPTPEPTQTEKTAPSALPENLPEIVVKPTPEVIPEPTPQVKTEPTPETTPEIKPEPTPEATPEIKPEPTPEATPEIKPEPTPEATPEVKTEPTPEVPTISETDISKTTKLTQFPPSPNVQKKPTETVTEETPVAPTTSTTPKPIFEPIVIKVGTTETTPTPEPEKTPEKVDEKIEKTVETPSDPKPEKTVPADILSGQSRPRVILTDSNGQTTEVFPSCTVVVNPSIFELLSNGGRVAVNVSIEGDGDFRDLVATSTNPQDVEVRVEPDIGASQNRAMFILRSISSQTGNFTVTFEAPCGKTEITVKVR